MKKKICTACGKKINSQSAYCPSCGTEVVREEIEEVKEHKKGKEGIKFLLISLAIQIVLIVLFVVLMAAESETVFFGVVTLLMIASPFLVLAASIATIVKSKRTHKKGGMVLGGFFAVINVILGFLFCAVLFLDALSRSNAYKMAVDYFEAEDYRAAISKFEDCDGYRDSDYLYRESFYRLGAEAVSIEDYEGAVHYFSKIVGHEDADEQLVFAKYNLGLVYLDEEKYSQAAKLFADIKDYEDAEEQFLYARYHSGITLLEYELYEEAADVFEEISGYEDADELFELSRKTAAANKDLIEKIQGTYKFVDTGNVHYSSKLVVQEKKFYDYYDTLNTAYGTKISHVDSEKNAIYLKNSYWYILKDGKLYEYEYDDEYNELTKKYETVYKNELRCVWEKTDLNIKLSPKDPKEEPAIGMTADEVRKSTWGSPKEINRTTTAYGIHEQWVYSNYRYIYLDDGIVTAIQD